MTRETARRAGQALLLWAAIGGPILLCWPGALRLPALWAVVVLGVLANALQPSYRLRDTVRARDDRGTFGQILLTVYLTQVAALVELVLRRPARLPFDAVAAGALLTMAAGIGLRTWAIATLGGWFTLRVDVKPAQRLVQEGPYRLMRHPSYLGALLAFAASAVLLHAWVAAILGTGALYLAFRRRIAHEERVLAAGLPGYQAYMARTGALVPQLSAVGGSRFCRGTRGRVARARRSPPESEARGRERPERPVPRSPGSREELVPEVAGDPVARDALLQ